MTVVGIASAIAIYDKFQTCKWQIQQANTRLTCMEDGLDSFEVLIDSIRDLRGPVSVMRVCLFKMGRFNLVHNVLPF